MTTVSLIGAGGIAELHLPALLSLGVDVVVFSGSPSAHKLVEKHGGGRAVDSLADALESCDVVDICTPTSTHRDLAIRGAELGKHIICEKPLALTLADARAMRDACVGSGVALFPAHVVRFFPEYAALRQTIHSGNLGVITAQEFSRTVSAPTVDWFSNPALSGGIATELMIHDLDFARWCAGEVSTIEAVTARHGTHRELTTVTATLTHSSGAVSRISATTGGDKTPFRSQFLVTGTLGQLQHDSTQNSPPVQSTPPTKSRDAAQSERALTPTDGLPADPYAVELGEFIDGALGGMTPRVTADDGVIAVELALAVNESLDLGEVIAMRAGG